MWTRSERVERLQQRNRNNQRLLIGTTLVSVVLGGGMLVSQRGDWTIAYGLLALIVLSFGVAVWRKTRTVLAFNDTPAYRRLVTAKGVLEVLQIGGVFGALALFSTGILTLPVMTGIIVTLTVGSIGVETLLDLALRKVDDEHVVTSLLGLSRRERLKQKWDDL